MTATHDFSGISGIGGQMEGKSGGFGLSGGCGTTIGKSGSTGN